VQVVPGPGWQEATSRDPLVRDLKARLGKVVSVEVRLVERIPAEASGKYRYVVSHAKLPFEAN
jgi:phenylacetate-CoA ligase